MYRVNAFFCIIYMGTALHLINRMTINLEKVWFLQKICNPVNSVIISVTFGTLHGWSSVSVEALLAVMAAINK